METKIADERILLFKDQLTAEQAKDLAWSKKVDAFGAMDKLASFLSKPKESEFEITYTEYRYQPIWHIKGMFKYVYDRKTVYKWQTSGKEVQSISINGQEFPAAKTDVLVEAIDHCQEEEQLEVFVDGISGEKQSTLSKYLSFIAEVKQKEEMEKLTEEKVIIVPPKARVSALVNEILAHSMKAIQADKVFEEKIEISNVDLYYRPVYAFQCHWISKKKDIVIEVDALTGEVKFGHQIFKEYLGKVLDMNFLFDVGADVAGMILPGGSIAVKVAKKYIDSKK